MTPSSGRRRREGLFVLRPCDDFDSYSGRSRPASAESTIAAGDALLSPAVTKRVIKQFTRIPRPAPRRELDELSAREREILRLIAQGLSNAEIGSQLYISEMTVKTHVTHVLQKLNLLDRLQAVVLAYQSGLVEPDRTTEAEPTPNQS